MISNILFMVAFVIIILFVHNILRIFVLSKLKVNKWIILCISIVSLLLGAYISVAASGSDNNLMRIGSYICLFITAISMLWFMDMRMSTKSLSNNKKNDVVIKSKPKPNRLKNISDKEKAKVLINNTKSNRKK